MNAEFVAMLRDAAGEDGTDLESLADLSGVVLVFLETEDSAAREDLEARQLRKSADQAFGEAVAKVIIVGISGSVDERQDSEGVDASSGGLLAQEVDGGGAAMTTRQRRCRRPFLRERGGGLGLRMMGRGRGGLDYGGGVRKASGFGVALEATRSVRRSVAL